MTERQVGEGRASGRHKNGGKERREEDSRRKEELIVDTWMERLGWGWREEWGGKTKGKEGKGELKVGWKAGKG